MRHFYQVGRAIALAVALSPPVCSASQSSRDWPSVRSFDADHLLRVALPLGGIGCGSVSLSGRGELVDWEIMNSPNKGMADQSPIVRTFFAIRVKGDSHESTTMLAGSLHPVELYTRCAAERQ